MGMLRDEGLRKRDETSEQMILEFFSCVLWIFTYDQRYGNER